jgi:hypothetical protein
MVVARWENLAREGKGLGWVAGLLGGLRIAVERGSGLGYGNMWSRDG